MFYITFNFEWHNNNTHSLDDSYSLITTNYLNLENKQTLALILPIIQLLNFILIVKACHLSLINVMVFKGLSSIKSNQKKG
jgi:hypothetical protein